MMTRKILSLLDLIDEYSAMSPELMSSDLTKSQRRDLWRWRLLAKYPDLECCPFCGSTTNDDYGVTYTEAVRFQSLHHSGNPAYIECDRCNVKFEGDYGWHSKYSVITQWNNAKR